tara:strand:- start:859 stop:1020 length:162 start_codon:yes stop_codon:yes gene_type:complete
MAINLQIKGQLETKVDKAFNKVKQKNLFNNKIDFINQCIGNAIEDLYKNKVIN